MHDFSGPALVIDRCPDHCDHFRSVEFPDHWPSEHHPGATNYLDLYGVDRYNSCCRNHTRGRGRLAIRRTSERFLLLLFPPVSRWGQQERERWVFRECGQWGTRRLCQRSTLLAGPVVDLLA